MKIVLTGMGAVSAAGGGVARFVHATDGWRTALAESPRCVAPGVSPRLPSLDVGAVPDEALAGEPGDDRAIRLALPAVVEALRSAGVRPGDTARRVDLFVIGTSFGAIETALALQRAAHDPAAPERPWMQAGCHGVATTLATRLHLRAQVATYSGSCSSGLQALLFAAERIGRGEARLAVVGGVEALTPFSYAGYHALGALAAGRAAPWDVGSKGMALGEGAGFVVLESEESAEERGAVPLAELLSVALAHDSHHLVATHPEGRGLAGALEAALQEAALSASQLALVVGHGVGTPQGDFAELRAMTFVFGGDRALADRVALTSWKGALGHPLAASGLLSVIRAVAALRQQRVPPVVGLRHPVATFPVRLPKEPEPLRAGDAAVLTGGLGGHAAALLLRRVAAPVRSAGSEAAALAPARARAAIVARPLRMVRDEVVVISAALARPGDGAVDARAEFEQLHPAQSLHHLPEEGQLAFRAVKEALRGAAELLPPSSDVALLAGVDLESLPAAARFARALYEPGSGPPSPSLFAFAGAHSVAAAVAASFGFRGPVATAASGSFASAQALLDAALLLAEGRARRVVVFAYAPASEELERALRRAGSWGAAPDARPGVLAAPIAAAVVLGRSGDLPAAGAPRAIRLELRRRKRSSVTAPTGMPQLERLLGAQALVEVAQAAVALRAQPGPALPLRALDPCTGAALWMRVGLAPVATATLSGSAPFAPPADGR